VFWALTGNAGTNPSSNYIGTSDSQGLSIRTHGTQAISIDPSQNVSFAKMILGNINGTASGFTGSLAGDVTGGQGTTKVVGLQGTAVSATPPTSDGQVLKYNLDNGTWEPGADNTGLTAVNTGPGLTGDGTSSNPLSVDYSAVQPHFARTIVVSPDPSSAMASGAKLLDAVNGITDASSGHPYLVHLEPGIYDIGSSSLSMKPYVDIEGSGEDVTTIFAQNGNYTVAGASNAELRWLTVTNIAPSFEDRARAIFVDNSSPRLTHVTAIATSGRFDNVGIDIADSASPALSDVTANAGGGEDRNAGIAVADSSVTIDHSVILGPESLQVISGTAKVATSRFGTLPINEGGTLLCAADYDNSYSELSSTCGP
jgi:hypothetical protein